MKISPGLTQNQNNYNVGHNFLFRFFFFSHYIKISKSIKQLIKSKDELNCITGDQIPNILKQDQSKNLVKQFKKKLQEKQYKKLTVKKIIFTIIKIHKKILLCIYFFGLSQYMIKIFGSIFLEKSIQQLMQNNIQSTYLYAFLFLFLQIIAITMRHNSWNQLNIFVCRFKSTIILYDKSINLTQINIKQANIGKLIGLISSDLSVIQTKLYFIFAFLMSPFAYIAIIYVLVQRIGWYGLIPIIFTSLIIPYNIIVGYINGQKMQKINQVKDQRIKLINDVIQGIRLIKLYGWQMAFKNLIQKLRNSQVKGWIPYFIIQNSCKALSYSLPFIGCSITFLIMHFNNQEPTISQIFSTFQLINFFKVSVVFFSAQGLIFIFHLKIIFKIFIDIYQIKNTFENPQKKRIETLQTSQLFIHNQYQALQNSLTNYSVKFINYSASWTKNIQTLHNINLQFNQGQSYGIVGKIASGKSTLLLSLLDQIPYFNGQIKKKGSIAYVEQQPYIFSGTIKQNILFRGQMNDERYNKVLISCCLNEDLQIMPNGDMTEIGQKGINLSGGQKARICLARALYSNADIYLLDDPLSAVDSKIARRLFNNVIKEFLKSKTTILVTHQVHYVFEMDNAIILNEGKVLKQDKPKRIQSNLKELLLYQQKQKQKQRSQKDFKKQKKITQLIIEDISNFQNKDGNLIKLQKQQNIETGINIYFKYFKNTTYTIFLFIMFAFFIISEVLYVFFIRIYSNYGQKFQQNNYILIQTGILILAYLITLIVKEILLQYVCLYANKNIHQKMVSKVVRAKVVYFDMHPTGRIINRFSNDIGIMDQLLAFCLSDVIQGPIIFITIMINMFEITYWFIIPCFLCTSLIIILYFYFKNIILSARMFDLRQKSPIFSHFSSTLSGILQIKTYKRIQNFSDQMSTYVDNSFKATFSYFYTTRCLGYYVNMVIQLIIFFGLIMTIQLSINNVQGKFATSSVLLVHLGIFIQFVDRQLINLVNFINKDSIMIAVGRSLSLTQIEEEGSYQQKNDRKLILDQWGKKGNVVMNNVFMKYRSNLDYTLKGINLEIRNGQKIGIVGRTDSGKSSIIQSLFRIVEIENQSEILIDNQNTKNIGIGILRKSISIIPQSSLLFTGTIRQNIDPFNEFDQDQIKNALQKASLSEYIFSLEDKLQTRLSVNNDIFSVGQKQLLCLARAIIRNNKILVLDQATSNVDIQTDEHVQKTLKMHFAQCTIITIAHRLNTIADNDKVFIIDNGKIKQYGHPYQLLHKQNSEFSIMASHTGQQNEKLIYKISQEAYMKKFK